MAGANVTYGIQHILSAIDKISAPAKKINANLKKTASTADKVKSALKNAFAFVGVAVGFNMIKSGLTDVINLGREVDKTLMSVGSKLGFSKGSEEYDRLNQKAREVGENTIFSTSEVTKAFDYLAMAGFDSVEALTSNIDSLTNIAQASGLGLDRATDIASDVMGMWNIDMTHVGDVMAKTANSANTTFEALFDGFKNVGPVANAFGASIEETSATLSILANQGIKGGEAGNKLKRIMSNLANPTGRTAKALAEFGIETKDAQGNMLAFGDIMKQIEAQYQKLGGEGNADALAMLGDIAGTEAMGALSALMNAGSEELDKFADMYRNAGGAASEMAEVMAQSTDAKFKSVASKWEALKLAMNDKMDSGLNSMLSAIIDALPGLMVGFKILGSIFNVFFKIIGVVIRFLGNLIVDLQKIPRPIKIIIGIVLGLIAAFKIFNIIMSITNAIMLMNPTTFIIVGIIALIAILYVLIRYWHKFKDFFITIWDKIKPPFVAFANFFVELWQHISGFFIRHWDGIKKYLMILFLVLFAPLIFAIKIVITVVKAIVNFFIKHWELVKKALLIIFLVMFLPLIITIGLIVLLVRGVVKFFIKHWSKIKGFFVALWNFLKAVFMFWIAYLKFLFITIPVWIYTKIIKPIGEFFSALWTRIVDAFKSFWTKLKNLMSAMWSWIKTNVVEPIASGFSWLWGFIKEAWSTVWEKLKDVFGAMWSWLDEHVIQPIASLFSLLWTGIKAGWDIAWEGLKKAFSKIVEFFKDVIITPITDFFGKMWDGIKKIFKKDKDEMKDELSDLVDTANGKSATSSTFSITSTTTRLQEIINKGTTTLPETPEPLPISTTPVTSFTTVADEMNIPDSKELMGEEYVDLAVKHSVAKAQAEYDFTVGGRIDVMITGAGKVTNVESDNENVPIFTSMNRGGANDC